MNSFIECFTSPDILSTTKENHSKISQVFPEMLNSYKETLPTAQYMDLFYFFNRLERGMAHLRGKDINTAACFFEKLELSGADVNSEFAPYVDALNLYVQAYQFYMADDTDSACDYAARSLDRIGELNSQSPFSLPGSLDLHVKLLPILFHLKTSGELARIFSGYLHLFLEGDTVKIASAYNGIAQLSEEHKRAWLFYILENLLHFANEYFKTDVAAQEAFVLEMIGSLFQQINTVPEENNDIYNGLVLAHQLLRQEDVYDPGERLAEKIDAVKRCPEFLKQLLLRKYVDYLSQHSIDYSSHKNYSSFISTLESYKVTPDDNFWRKNVAV